MVQQIGRLFQWMLDMCSIYFGKIGVLILVWLMHLVCTLKQLKYRSNQLGSCTFTYEAKLLSKMEWMFVLLKVFFSWMFPLNLGFLTQFEAVISKMDWMLFLLRSWSSLKVLFSWMLLTVGSWFCNTSFCL